MKMIEQGMYATLKTGKFASTMNVGNLLEKLKAKDELLESNLSNLMTSVRGSQEFWSQKGSDLSAMDEKWGPATFFMTLSSAEYEWEELRDYITRIDPNAKDLSQVEMCARNPVAVSIFFHHRFVRFFKDVLQGNPGADGELPLGKISHYAWRIEYQARGGK